MRLYHERADRRTGAFGAGDEEECFTAFGRKQGVWLTSESIDGPTVVSADVDADDATPYDVTGEDGEPPRLRRARRRGGRLGFRLGA